LVTRNPKWSQRLGTETDYVKGRYWHPKYALPKVICIVLLSNKNLRSHHVGPSMVQEKPSSVMRFLSYGVKPNRSNVYKRTIVLRSGIRFTCKLVPRILKDKQNKFFVVFEILANVLLTLINWLLKPKCMLKYFFCMKKKTMIFLALRHLDVYTKTFFFFFQFFFVF